MRDPILYSSTDPIPDYVVISYVSLIFLCLSNQEFFLNIFYSFFVLCE